MATKLGIVGVDDEFGRRRNVPLVSLAGLMACTPMQYFEPPSNPVKSASASFEVTFITEDATGDANEVLVVQPPDGSFTARSLS